MVYYLRRKVERMSETKAIYQAGQQEPKVYNDYVFWTRAKGDVLSTESLPATEAEGRARQLAREYKTTVSYAIVLDYFIEPVFCAQCGEVAPENGPCGCSRFEEEEAPTDFIPFQGEAYPARIVTEQDEYF